MSLKSLRFFIYCGRISLSGSDLNSNAKWKQVLVVYNSIRLVFSTQGLSLSFRKLPALLDKIKPLSTAAAAKLLQSCPTLCNPKDSSPPGSPVPGILQQEHWSGLPLPSPIIGATSLICAVHNLWDHTWQPWLYLWHQNTLFTLYLHLMCVTKPICILHMLYKSVPSLQCLCKSYWLVNC